MLRKAFQTAFTGSAEFIFPKAACLQSRSRKKPNDQLVIKVQFHDVNEQTVLVGLPLQKL